MPECVELVDGGVPVRFVDLPDVGDGAMGRFVLTMMVALAELEAKRTGERTKAALQAARLVVSSWGRWSG
jgi:DNA invertase Pin-like site-specific DNA recombinase